MVVLHTVECSVATAVFDGPDGNTTNCRSRARGQCSTTSPSRFGELFLVRAAAVKVATEP